MPIDSISKPISYKRDPFPPGIIARAVWVYFRFSLSLRLVEEVLIERGIIVFYETIHRRAGSSGAIMLGAFIACRHARLAFGTGRFSVHDFLRRDHGVVAQNNRGQAPCV